VSPAQPRSGHGAGKIVESLPTEIADVVTGRSWSADKQGGFYRAILAMTGAGLAPAAPPPNAGTNIPKDDYRMG